MPTNISGTTGITVPSTAAPAFAAYSNVSQSISSQTLTKIQFNLETFDTNSNYDNATNYRFTPTIAGYYQISATVCPSTNQNSFTSIYKNGSLAYSGNVSGNNFAGNASTISCLIYFNGTTDYVECYAAFNGASNLYNANGWSWFQGVFVRSA